MDDAESILEEGLSRRERQIISVVYRLGKAGVADIIANIPNAPTSGAVRRMLNILEGKGLLKGKQSGLRKLYYPTVKREDASSSALEHVVKTYFKGSAGSAMVALLESTSSGLSDEELETISFLIEEAKKEKR
jgi:BlaI family penicillinase repressor